MKLTPKQQAFADYYIETGNALDSAKRAGYKQPQIQGHENLEKPRIKAYIAERMEEKDKQRIMDADEALELLTSIARGELSETVVTPSGKTIRRKADINQRIKAVDSLMKRFNVIASLDKTKAETELLKQKTRLLQGSSDSDNQRVTIIDDIALIKSELKNDAD